MKLLSNLSILVVEDEGEMRQIMMDDLTFHGASVRGAANGKIALDLLQQNSFDVLVTDIRMPDGNGIDLLKNVNQLMNKTPKIFIFTAFDDLSEEEAKDLGIIKCFHKPFNLKECALAISKSFDRPVL